MLLVTGDKDYMKILKIVFRVLSIICYVGIAVYGLLYIPMLFGYKPETVVSESMVPALNRGDLVYYQMIPREDIKLGDIVVFKNGDNLVMHRVSEITEEGHYVTKGDANSESDEGYLNYYQIEGRVAPKKIPVAGYVVKFINENAWIIVIVAMILAVQFLLNLNLKKTKNADKKKE